MFGTKCPSITSRWIQSAPAASTAQTSSPSFEKSDARIEGAIASGRGTNAWDMSALAKRLVRDARLTCAKVRGNRDTGAEKSAGCGINCRGFGRLRMRKALCFPGFLAMAQPLLVRSTSPCEDWYGVSGRDLAAFVGVPCHVHGSWRRDVPLGHLAVAGNVEQFVHPIHRREPDRVKPVLGDRPCGAFDELSADVRNRQLQPDFAADHERAARCAKPDRHDQHLGLDDAVAGAAKPVLRYRRQWRR